MAGHDPSHVELCQEGENFGETFSDLAPAKAMLINAINAGKLKATIRRTAWERGYDEEPTDSEVFTKEFTILPIDVFEADVENLNHLKIRGIIYRVNPDWNKTSVSVDVLKAWLSSRGLCTGFFFPNEIKDAVDYLNRRNPRYAPKLAAAVSAWQAMADPNLMHGKAPYTAMKNWLESNYKTLELTHSRDNEKNRTKAGDMNKLAIEEAAKVANWLPDGGAPKTPTRHT